MGVGEDGVDVGEDGGDVGEGGGCSSYGILLRWFLATLSVLVFSSSLS